MKFETLVYVISLSFKVEIDYKYFKLIVNQVETNNDRETNYCIKIYKLIVFIFWEKNIIYQKKNECGEVRHVRKEKVIGMWVGYRFWARNL